MNIKTDYSKENLIIILSNELANIINDQFTLAHILQEISWMNILNNFSKKLINHILKIVSRE